jgi:hypothetical protein
MIIMIILLQNNLITPLYALTCIEVGNQDNVLNLVTIDYGLKDSGIDSLQRQEFFFLLPTSILYLGPTLPPMQLVLRILFLSAKQPGRDADSVLLSSVEVRIIGAIPLIQSIQMAARSKSWVCGRSLAGTAGSNPAGGMDVCFLWVLCIVR